MVHRKSIACRSVRPTGLSNRALVAVIAALSLVPRFAPANTIASSISNATQTVAFSPGHWAASPFTTGYQSWLLTNVTLSLLQGGVNSSLADVRLFSDNAGQVGVSLADLGVQTITGFQSQLWSFTASTDIPLAPHTTYWIGVGNVSPDQGLSVDLVLAAPFTFTGAGSVSMDFSGATGVGSGVNPPAAFDPPGAGAAVPFQADGTATSVPEPASSTVLLLGAATFLAFRRLRRLVAA